MEKGGGSESREPCEGKCCVGRGGDAQRAVQADNGSLGEAEAITGEKTGWAGVDQAKGLYSLSGERLGGRERLRRGGRMARGQTASHGDSEQ